MFRILQMKCELMIKHSNFFKNIYTTAIITGIALICGFPLNAKAQMFSVGEDNPRFNVPQTEFYLGLEPMDVTYQGGQSGLNSGIFAFEGPIIRLGYNSGSLDLFAGAGGKITGLDDVAYFDIGGNIDFGLNLYRTDNFAVLLPFRVASHFTNMTNSSFGVQNFERFRIGSLTAGVGGRVLGLPSENIRIEAGAVPTYGFSFASGGLFGGSLGTILANARLYFDRVFDDFGISIGYKYDYRYYDVEDNFYDYKINGHSFEVGVTF
jgi:hypothetical protein